MNKLLIVLLAVCLVSTHGFVKRDAPAPSSDIQTKIDEAKTAIVGFGKTLSEQAAKAFDPETLKKGFNDMIDSAKQTYDKFKPAGDAKPAPAA